MSLSEVILFPFVPQELYNEYRILKKTFVKDAKSLSYKLKDLFESSKKGEKLAQIILFDFYMSINHHSINKDNITGKRLEQRLSMLFALSTGDELKKQNPKIESLMTQDEIKNFDKDVLDLVCSNYRDKGDLFFFNPKENNLYKLSIKTLVTSNKEINFGAFEFQSTFKGVKGIEELLNTQERSRSINIESNGRIISDIGLGSSKQMKQLVEFIKLKGKMNEYLSCFEILLKGVYKDDFLIYIKNSNRFSVYVLENKDFISIILDKVKNGFLNTRIESNAIRVTDLDNFKNKSMYKFDMPLIEAIPDFYEIENLVVKSDHNKLLDFRKFINSK
jgi:hypothetical protein